MFDILILIIKSILLLNLYHIHINIHISLFIVFIILRLISLLYVVFHIKDFHKSDNYKIHQT